MNLIHRKEIKQTVVRELTTVPCWMQYALEGKKLDAMAALRHVPCENGTPDAKFVSLLDAKIIVEDFMSCISEWTE